MLFSSANLSAKLAPATPAPFACPFIAPSAALPFALLFPASECAFGVVTSGQSTFSSLRTTYSTQLFPPPPPPTTPPAPLAARGSNVATDSPAYPLLPSTEVRWAIWWQSWCSMGAFAFWRYLLSLVFRGKSLSAKKTAVLQSFRRPKVTPNPHPHSRPQRCCLAIRRPSRSFAGAPRRSRSSPTPRAPRVPEDWWRTRSSARAP